MCKSGLQGEEGVEERDSPRHPYRFTIIMVIKGKKVKNRQGDAAPYTNIIILDWW